MKLPSVFIRHIWVDLLDGRDLDGFRSREIMAPGSPGKVAAFGDEITVVIGAFGNSGLEFERARRNREISVRCEVRVGVARCNNFDLLFFCVRRPKHFTGVNAVGEAKTADHCGCEEDFVGFHIFSFNFNGG